VFIKLGRPQVKADTQGVQTLIVKDPVIANIRKLVKNKRLIK
jgi:hypothetical protein